MWDGDIVVSGLGSCVAGEAIPQDVSLERSRFESKKMSSILLIRPEKCTLGGAIRFGELFEVPVQGRPGGMGSI